MASPTQWTWVCVNSGSWWWTEKPGVLHSMGSQRVGHYWVTEHLNWCFWAVVLEETLESPLDCKDIKPINSKGNQSWIFIGRTDAEAETPILWPPDVKNWIIGKDPDAGWERLNVGGEGGDRGWDGWMASPTRWTWVWASSRSWWWTGRPGVLQSMGSQRVRHNWATKLNWTYKHVPANHISQS